MKHLSLIMMNPIWTVHVMVTILLLPCNTAAFPESVYESEYKWIQEGDVNIGAILTIHSLDPQSLVSCTEYIEDIRNVQNVEALSFAVQEINSRPDILQGVKLGFVILDDCSSSSMALARAIQFMPSDVRARGVCPHNGNCTDSREGNKDDVFYDVAGVIGTYTSKLSIVVANVLNLFQIPQISHTASSNILSDKSRFPYFFRMVPPDRYQTMVIASVLNYFNWSHVSIVYSEGSYGREGVKQLQHILQSSKSAMCVEDILEIGYRFTAEEILPILEKLNSRADTKVVIAFVEIDDGKVLSSALKMAGLVNRFIWIGSDSISLTIEEHPSLCQSFPGSISVQPHFRHVERFQDHLKELNTQKGKRESRNPWLLELTRQSINYRKNDLLRSLLDPETESFIKSSFVDSFLIDSVYAFAFAMDSVVKKHCPEVMKDRGNLSRCISGARIYNELKSIRFNGSLGESQFNENGDIMTKYEIYQCSGDYMNLRQIGIWEMENERLHMNTRELSWPIHSGIPRSSCPRPCTETVGSIFYFTKQTCCHVCVTCKVNEIVTANATRCEVCPEFYWPKNDRYSCIPIQPFYFGLDNAVSIGLCAVAVTGVMICLCIGIILIKYRDEHVIKSTSVELSSLILLGTCLTFVLTGSFLSRPNNYKCYINNVGFSLTFTIVYGPLLVKTNRIYRIFNAGRRTTMRPCFISKSSQVFISLFLIFLQVGVVIVSTSLHPPEVILHMASRTEKFVELFCNLPSECLLSSLSYNLILVAICTFYAFKTRKLPDNYKESRYIAYCVDTTLLIWITFVPTYFTTSRAAAKITILSVSLLLNASVTIACLFVPRIYSLYKSLQNTCSGNGHHYKDFRIVKHVVKRKRSVELKTEVTDPLTTRRVSSAVTITSDIFQNNGEVTISVAQSTQTCLELKETTCMTPVNESDIEERVEFS